MQPKYATAPRRRRTENSNDALACGLGYFSLALGAAELLAPHALARWLGRPQDAGALRACGLREVGTGLGILRSEDRAFWLWGRVSGDMVDLALLGRGLQGPRRRNAAVAMGTVAAVTLLDVVCARALTEAEDGSYVAPDYSDRSGFPKPAAEMRGAATGWADGGKASGVDESRTAGAGLP